MRRQCKQRRQAMGRLVSLQRALRDRQNRGRRPLLPVVYVVDKNGHKMQTTEVKVAMLEGDTLVCF